MSKFKAQYINENDLALAHLNLHNVGHEACDPLHSWSGVREFYSIHTIVSGRGVYQLEDKTFPLGEGDSFLVYPNIPVAYTADQQEPWEYLWLGVSGVFVKNMIEMSGFTQEVPCLYGESDLGLKEAMEQIYQAKGTGYHNEIQMIGYTYLMFSKLITGEKGLVSVSGERYAQRGKEYIDLNYASGINAQQVADQLNLSRSHLHRLFTEAYEISVGKYINMLRMNRASLLLRSTDLSIHEISNSVGYENQLYFSNVFKKNTGFSPSEYRKKNILKQLETENQLEKI